jgi:hypothetical protein
MDLLEQAVTPSSQDSISCTQKKRNKILADALPTAETIFQTYLKNLSGESRRALLRQLTKLCQPPPPNPSGLCLCGCGERTNIALTSSLRDGVIKGQYLPYVQFHAQRKSPVEYLVEDRGYRTPCWIWQRAAGGPRKDNQYGIMTVDGQYVRSHIWYYEQRFGSVPAGMELDHLCHVTLCCNPDHLEAVTHRVNVQRGLEYRLQNGMRDQVLRMKAMRAAGSTYREIGREFGMSGTHAWNICRGKCWSGVNLTE